MDKILVVGYESGVVVDDDRDSGAVDILVCDDNGDYW